MNIYIKKTLEILEFTSIIRTSSRIREERRILFLCINRRILEHYTYISYDPHHIINDVLCFAGFSWMRDVTDLPVRPPKKAVQAKGRLVQPKQIYTQQFIRQHINIDIKVHRTQVFTMM